MGRGGGECATALRLNNELKDETRVATRSSAGSSYGAPTTTRKHHDFSHW